MFGITTRVPLVGAAALVFALLLLPFLAGRGAAQTTGAASGFAHAGQVALAYTGRAIDVAGGRAYVVTEGRTGSTHFPHVSTLEILDVADPAAPRRLSSTAITHTMGDARANDVAVQGDFAYVATGPDYGTTMEGGLRVFDVRDPASPSQQARIVPSGWVNSLEVSGNYAYLAHEQGFEVVDVPDPVRPAVVMRVEIPGGANDVALRGSYAYVTTAPGLTVIDLSDPRQPAAVGSYQSADRASVYRTGYLAIDGDRAYLGRYDALIVLDLSDPVRPREVGRVALAGAGAGRVSVSGTVVYAAGSTYGVGAVDVSDPTAPRVLAQSVTLGEAHHVVPVGDRLLVAGGSGLVLARHPAAVWRSILPWIGAGS